MSDDRSAGVRPRAQRWLITPLAGLFLALGILLPSTQAQAIPYSFSCITQNNPLDCAIGEAQIVMDVVQQGQRVRFNFSNLGPEDSSIRGVYFDDGALLTLEKIFDNPPDVEFLADPNAGPSDLPGGSVLNPPFVVTMGFLALAVPPPAQAGVDPNETLGIRFDLQGGMSFQDVIDDLADGSLRVGIHVIDFASEGSESFVAIPEPGTLAMLGAGLIAMLALARRRGRRT